MGDLPCQRHSDGHHQVRGRVDTSRCRRAGLAGARATQAVVRWDGKRLCGAARNLRSTPSTGTSPARLARTSRMPGALCSAAGSRSRRFSMATWSGSSTAHRSAVRGCRRGGHDQPCGCSDRHDHRGGDRHRPTRHHRLSRRCFGARYGRCVVVLQEARRQRGRLCRCLHEEHPLGCGASPLLGRCGGRHGIAGAARSR